MFLNLIFFNRYFDKNRLKALILWSLNKSGEKNTIDLVEKLKDLGFHYATEAGLSLGIDDLKIPPTKSELILDAEITVRNSQKDYEIGNVTVVEKFQQLIDIWHRTSEILKQNVITHFRSTDILNPVYMMAVSGARGNISQVRQLVGMRGLMADPQGQILDFPIRSNFREGLTLTEYVISCYGARKGLVDTALRTANSGYLTRRLVDVAQHIIVRQLDCGTNNGITITDLKDGRKVIFSLQKRLIGRVLGESIENIARKNQDISPSLALKIAKVKSQIIVRSPLSCEAKNSVCQLCYGWSLAHGSLVSLGEAVGILAAQSIGEPGTQLTMRTFHTGGVFSGDIIQEIRSPFSGIITFTNPLQGVLIRTLHGKIAFLTKTEGELIVHKSPNSNLECEPYSPNIGLNGILNGSSGNDSTKNKSTSNKIQPSLLESDIKVNYNLPVSTVLFIRELEKVKDKQLLAEYSSIFTANNQGIEAKYNVNSEIEGQVYFENVLLVVKSSKEGDLIRTAFKFGSFWILSGKLYQSPIRSNLFIKKSDLVDNSSILNESILVTPYSGTLKTSGKKTKKYSFLNKKATSLFNETTFLKEILVSQKNKPNLKFHFQKNNSPQKELVLNQKFFEINFRRIHYKKIGYFLSLEKDYYQQLFLNNPLNSDQIDLSELALQWLSKPKLETKSLSLYDKNFGSSEGSSYHSYERGESFLVSQNIYKIKTKKCLSPLLKGCFQITRKTDKVAVYENKRGDHFNIFSKENGFFHFSSVSLYRFKNLKASNKTEQTLLFNFENDLVDEILTKKLTYKKNPGMFLQNNKFSRKRVILKDLISQFNLSLKKEKIRKNIFNSQHYNLLITNLNSYNEKRNNSKEKEKNNFVTFKIRSGWIFLSKSKTQKLLKNHSFFGPTYPRKSFHFDQHYTVIKTFHGNNKFLFFSQTDQLKQICFIKNKLFRYNKIHQQIINPIKVKKYKTSTLQNYLINSINFLKIQKNLKISRSSSQYYDFSVPVKIRNKIYKNNYKFYFVFLIEIQKAKVLKLSSKIEIKNEFHKITISDKKLKNVYLNKQKVTRLKHPYPSIDIKIKKNKLYPNQFSNIYFNLQTNYPIKKGNLKINFGKILNYSVNRTIEPLNSLGTNTFKQKQTKVLITSEKNISEQTNLAFKSFFSPDQGEITTITRDSIGKEKSILLTNNDQISFSTNENSLLVQIGQLVRYGDQIINNTAVTESGQIIQIDKTKITLRKAQPILFSSQGVFHVNNGDIIDKNTPLLTLFYQKLKTEDIVQGIPKIEELFEARQTKEGETLQENLHTKLSILFNVYKQQYTSQEAVRKSIEKIQQILVNNVQKVYQSQGVSIADKHVEIIVRQMTTKVKITESGRTGLLRGELIDLEWVEVINLGIEAQNEMTNQVIEVEKAEYEPIILGITKASLETESFISASSFQETTRILSRAAIERKTDFLRGLKENVILGHLIPAGTGFTLSFDPQIKVSNHFKKFSFLNYKDIVTMFSQNVTTS